MFTGILYGKPWRWPGRSGAAGCGGRREVLLEARWENTNGLCCLGECTGAAGTGPELLRIRVILEWQNSCPGGAEWTPRIFEQPIRQIQAVVHRPTETRARRGALRGLSQGLWFNRVILGE